MKEKAFSRREFLIGLIRWGATVASVAGAAALTRRDSQACTNPGICRSCGKLANCGLPQALSAKAGERRP